MLDLLGPQSVSHVGKNSRFFLLILVAVALLGQSFGATWHALLHRLEPEQTRLSLASLPTDETELGHTQHTCQLCRLLHRHPLATGSASHLPIHFLIDKSHIDLGAHLEPTLRDALATAPKQSPPQA